MEKKLAAYIRVSSKSKSQLHSFKTQEEYWRQALSRIEGATFVAIFADEGISGKAQKNRRQFQNMVEAAKRGEINTVYCKSVSRFGRDTEELLRSVRTLKELGVNVVFETENIDTAQGGTEVYLTIAAAVAEDQLRTYSKNLQWSVRDKFERGELIIGRVYGYKFIKGKLQVVESEADTVRLIFCLYEQGLGKQAIASELTRRGIPTMLGGERWSAQTISNIISNEKYLGHCLLHKTIERDFERQELQNIAPIFIQNTHEAIVSEQQWQRVQDIRASKATSQTEYKPPPDYPFKSKIFCGSCGKGYIHKINSPGTKWAKPMYKCITSSRIGKSGCTEKAIFDEVLEWIFVAAYNSFVAKRAEFEKKCDAVQKREKLLGDERKLRSLFAQRLISQTDFVKENEFILSHIRAVDLEIKQAAMYDTSGRAAKAKLEFDGDMVLDYLEKATIKSDTITFKFINGYSVTLPYSNGQSGNQKGWKERRKAQ